jgi:hypothetical protein
MVSIMSIALFCSNENVTEPEDGRLDVACVGLSTGHSTGWWYHGVKKQVDARLGKEGHQIDGGVRIFKNTQNE